MKENRAENYELKGEIMKYLVKAGFLALAVGFIFIGVDTANAQRNREARREYRKDVREARKDYQRRVNQGNYRKARREYREDIRDARKDYRRSNRGNISRDRMWNNRRYNMNRRVYPANNGRYIYRNGRVYRRW